MAITTLDPHTALVVIDLQQGIVAYPTVHPAAEVVQRAAALANAFRARALPVFFVNVAGAAPGRNDQGAGGSKSFPAQFIELVPELARRADEPLVTKRTWGAFMHTDLEARLKQRGVTQVVLVGISTSIGVESTARQAYELGFNVTLPTDAMTDTNAEAHANSVARIFPRLGETGSAADVIALVQGRHA